MMSQAVKPRVHWVCPLPPEETDIAQYTWRILPELAAACDLTLWTDAPRWDPRLEAIAPVRRLDPDRAVPADFIRRGHPATDVLFIHIGNAPFHHGLLRLARRIPSVVVLHDLALQEMLRDGVVRGRLSRRMYLSDMGRWHGAAGQALARDFLDGAVVAPDMVAQIPGFEVVLPQALGVLTHTQGAFEAVAARGAVAAWRLPLPFRTPDTPLPPRAPRAPDAPLRLVQFGFIGPNRRLDTILKALGRLQGQIPFEFRIFGRLWDPHHIQSQIDALGLGAQVSIGGFVPEPELDAHIAQADLVFNLRHPTMGEASGSQLRLWTAGAAAVVTDHAWYGELPRDTVFHIPPPPADDPSAEITALAELLRDLAQDRARIADVRAAGFAHVTTHHTARAYAQAIADLARQIPDEARQCLLAEAARAVQIPKQTASDPAVSALVSGALMSGFPDL